MSALFNWIPSVWYDEDATITSSTRSWDDLWRMLHHVDAVHAFYYGIMHVWFQVAGYSPFTLRFPSAVAVGLTAAFTFLIGRRLASPATGITAAIVACLLPRIMWAGVEGRSYALTAALAMALTYIFLLALDAHRSAAPAWAFWLLYGVVGIISVYLFLFSALIVVAHLVAVFALTLTRPEERSRTLLVPLLLTPLAILVVALPLLRLSASESVQVGWIEPLGPRTLHVIFIDQWFWGDLPFALIGWALLVAGSIRLAILGRNSATWRLLIVSLAGAFVPLVLVLVVSAAIKPFYLDRYMTFTTPFVALLVAAAISALPWRTLTALCLAGLLVLAAGPYLQLRSASAKDGAAWQAIATRLTMERAREAPDSSDVVVYGALPKRTIVSTRLIADAYPAAFHNMEDLTLATTGRASGTLWGSAVPVSTRVDRLRSADQVWLVAAAYSGWYGTTSEALAKKGFHVRGHWVVGGADVVRYAR